MRWLAVLACLVAAVPVAAQDWRPVDAQNSLVIDSSKGRIIVELYPQVAPKAVERVRMLARRGTYDGLQLWRVVPGFVAQADPGNVEGGKTELPNLPPEFTFRLRPPDMVDAASPAGVTEGFVGALPVIASTRVADDGTRRAWASYCPGVMGMGRDMADDTANAEIFFMLGAYPSLDRDYTPVGQVIVGQDVLQALQAGTPAPHPDVITKVRVLADMAAPPRIEVMDTHGKAFARIVAKARKSRGADFSVCDIAVPARVRP